MHRVRKLVLAGLLGVPVLFAIPVHAEAPESSIRPMPRPLADAAPNDAFATVPQVDGALLFAGATVDLMPVRPRPRPQIILATAARLAPATAAPQIVPAPVTQRSFGGVRPLARPKGLVARQAAAVRTLPGKDVVVSKKGSVCGIPDIKGETLSPISAKVRGCGIAHPVRVTSVAGVRLSTPATIGCETAKALRSWVTQSVAQVYGKGRVVELKIAASYACRPRNNQRGAKVSEHGRGNAIDIAGFTFSDGRTAMVRGGYDRNMRKVHKAACGTFGTTLGPGSDGFHEDHLHFDVARYRGGPYCR